MVESRNRSDTDNTSCEIEMFQWVARELFRRVNSHIEDATNRGILWERFAPSTETSGTDGRSHEEAACRENDGAVQQHLISRLVYRWIETENGDEWELENVWDNVNIRQLDDIGQKANYEWRPVNYSGQKNIQVAMAENVNIVLLRTIIDWSRVDGNVWSQQLVWSGSFADCHRVLELLEDNGNSANSMELRGERFDLHPHLREQSIARHGSHPLPAAMAAVDSSPTVIISAEFVGTGDLEGDRLLCAICHDMLFNGEDDAKQLPCNHHFHRNCILKWFYLKLECPLCRNEFQRQIA